MAKSGNKDSKLTRLNLDSTETLLNSLPNELVIDIFSRLPVTNLWSLRSVSKSWFNFITANSDLAKSNFDLNTKSNNPSILSLDCKNNLYIATNYSSCDEAIKILSKDLSQYHIGNVCDGLICLPHNDDKEVCIWNPLTKDCVTIMCSPFVSNRFPGYVKCTSFSFGFDYFSQKYKVVRTCCESYYPKNEYHSEISVYTLGVDSTWRVVEDDIMVGLDSRPESVPFVNGVLHWLSKRSGSCVRGVICGFDLKDEVFREVLPPISLDWNVNSKQNEEIMELGGVLFIKQNEGIMELGGVLSILWRNDHRSCEIWMMEEYGAVNSWSRKFRFQWIDRLYYSSFGLDKSYVLGIALDGGILLIKKPEELIMLDQETNSFANLKGFRFRLFCAYPYFASLISPRRITGACQVIAE